MKPPKKKLNKVSANLGEVAETNSNVGSSFKTDECMSNLVVLRTVLSNLRTSDLINCRLVNKFWHSEVNSWMRRSNISLKISTERLLQQVGQLTNLIPQMSLPFNGLSFRQFPCPINFRIPRRPSLDDFLRVLPPIKHLRFNDSVASKEVILQILNSNTNDLEILSLDNCGMKLPPELLRAICQLKKLKEIRGSTYPYDYGDRDDWCEIMKKCKSLESLQGITFFEFNGVPQNQWHMIKCFNVRIASRPFDWTPLEKYFQVVPASHRFTSLSIKSMYFSPQAKHLALNLVKSCRLTLTSLRLDLGTVKLESVYDLCGECSKLRSLTILGHAQSRDDLESELLGIFPEELVLLRSMNLAATQLRKLQIVPVRPALHHLTGLVQLTIHTFWEESSTTLLIWKSKSDGNSFHHRQSDDAGEILSALSLERMSSLWNE